MTAEAPSSAPGDRRLPGMPPLEHSRTDGELRIARVGDPVAVRSFGPKAFRAPG
jgi:hypothetical protein